MSTTTATIERIERQPARGVEHPAAALSDARPRRHLYRGSRFRALGVGFLVLVVAAIWWSSRIDQDMSFQHLDEAIGHAPAVPQVEQPVALTMPNQSMVAASSSADSAQAQALEVTDQLAETEAATVDEKNKLNQARIEQETRAKRAAEGKRAVEAKRRSDELAQRQAAASEAQRKRDQEERIKREEAQQRRSQQPVAAAPAAVSPQQACAGSSNFISRGLCEGRECAKPQWAGLQYCVDMKERLKPRSTDH
ncbi:hypothetical protein ACFQAT_10925 [Undibacterium arcticum]|uniref:Uncharacterized protein n=1 Tax=Undibacterium arcticum TaxID=1762892 RepID=A0ABV7F3B8_9BURK